MALRQLKPFIPNFLWVGARRTRSYINRLMAWRSVQKLVTGCTPRDRRVISRSVQEGIRAASSDLDEWSDPVLVDDATVQVRGVGRFEIRPGTDDLYHVLPTREPAILKAVLGLTSGDLFVDAGANIGFYSVAAAKAVGRLGRVIAIEMMPDTAAILRHHLLINDCDNVELVQQALSDRSGEIVEAVVPVGRFGQASIMRGPTDSEHVRVQVVTATLDDVMGEDCRPVALMKLDLEGAELNALKGAALTLKRTQAVIFEALDDSSEICALLESAGFRLSRLDGNNLLAERD